MDGNGRASTNLDDNLAGTADWAAAVAVQSDGKIVVAGRTDPISGDAGDVALARYEPDGDLDPSFGTGGLVAVNLAGTVADSAEALAIQGTAGSPGFRIVVAGTQENALPDSDFAVAVLEEDGDRDPLFGGAGTGPLTSAISTRPEASRSAISEAARSGSSSPGRPTATTTATATGRWRSTRPTARSTLAPSDTGGAGKATFEL